MIVRLKDLSAADMEFLSAMFQFYDSPIKSLWLYICGVLPL